MNDTKAVTLTNEQWNLLSCYIIMTTNHRKGEANAWRELSQELKEDGTPRFTHAASNAQYYEELEDRLTEIRHIIDNAR